MRDGATLEMLSRECDVHFFSCPPNSHVELHGSHIPACSGHAIADWQPYEQGGDMMPSSC